MPRHLFGPFAQRQWVFSLAFLVLPLLMSMVLVTTSWLDRGRWWMELLSFSVPLVLAGLLLLWAAWTFVRPGWRAVWPLLLATFLALDPLKATFSWRGLLPSEAGEFRVMSFNAALFDPYRPVTLEGDPGRFQAFADHLSEHEVPDILCIQEFYHSTRAEAEMTADAIQEQGGYSFFYTNPTFDDKYGGLVGAITFSRFPVVAGGHVRLGTGVNDGHWVDLVIGSDTLRVFNLQFRSMSIRWRDHGHANTLRNAWVNAIDIHDRLRSGYRQRKHELDRVEHLLKESPYPVLLCVDLNALPYSHTYQRLRVRYRNAFEERGTGFGFTYHHFPWFIRIDNQFVDHRLTVTGYRTVHEVSVSDHYPVEATYRWGTRSGR